MMTHYQIEFDDYQQHLMHVTLRFLANPHQELWLPIWIPGSYLIREFAKHLENIQAFDEAGRNLDLRKTHKNKWQLYNQEHELISVEYDVYAYDLSVRGAYIDQTRLYVNPACACMALTGQENNPCEIELFIPKALQHFKLATALDHKQVVKGRYTLKAKHYDELIDCPFELAEQTHFKFNINNIPHDVYISGKHSTNVQRLQQDLEKICLYQHQLFKSAPFEHYTFMTMATGNHYGGLEHQNSTSLITPRQDLPKYNELNEPSSDYQRYLGLCSHEYFHAWLVKCIRPENFISYQLNQESYTRLLWIFEGFTSYYDDLILLRSGVISQQSYLALLTAQINRYLQNTGRFKQTVAESSFDAWIKYYRPDENSNQASTSYYNKGALVALCLDLSLRLHGVSLDDVLRKMYENARQGIQVNEQTIATICQELTGQNWQERIHFLTETTEELPLDQLFASFGIEYILQPNLCLPFGLKWQEKEYGLLIQSVERGSVASQAGLSAHDVLIAIDGLKANVALCKQLSQEQSRMIKVHVFRRDELLELELKSGETRHYEVQLSIKNVDLSARWLT